MIVNVVEGQLWSSTDGSRFKVIKQVNMYGKEWVWYINEDTNKEYSCWLESFVSRFRPDLNNHYSKGK
jgi:hypothetical protein